MSTNAEDLFDEFDAVPTDQELEAMAENMGSAEADAAAQGGEAATEAAGAPADAGGGEAAEGEADARGQDASLEQGKGTTVPLAVLLEERNAARQEMNELRSRLEKMQAIGEELRQWRESQAKAQQEAEQPKAPDYYEDPEGFVRAQVERGEKAINELNGRLESMTQQQQLASTLQNVQQHLTQIEGQFIQEHPDFDGALDHVRNFYVGNMTAMGQAQQEAEMQANKMIFVGQLTALQRGLNPAQFMYDMASRMGYRAPAPEESAGDTKAMEQVRMLAEAQRAGSMGSASGALDDLAGMDEDEFDQAMKEMGWS